jgi:hypothetical protein
VEALPLTPNGKLDRPRCLDPIKFKPSADFTRRVQLRARWLKSGGSFIAGPHRRSKAFSNLVAFAFGRASVCGDGEGSADVCRSRDLVPGADIAQLAALLKDDSTPECFNRRRSAVAGVTFLLRSCGGRQRP